MAAKKPIIDVFDQYYQALLYSLPMKDPAFLHELYKHGLLLEDAKSKLESLIAHKERASYFLDHVLKHGIVNSDNAKFFGLLTIMKMCDYDNVNDLAKEIEKDCTINDQLPIMAAEYSVTGLDEIKCSEKLLKSRPKHGNLSDLVTPGYAAKWKEIGILLGLMQSQLDIIEHDHGRSAIRCCNELWGIWLATHTDATWVKVLKSLEHSNVIKTENYNVEDNHIKKDESLPELDINQLMNTLPFIQEKWQLIGIKLGVRTDKLDLISQETKQAVPSESFNTCCCIKMLTYWLHNSDQVSADIIINVVSLPHIDLQDKVSSIKEALTSQRVSLSSDTPKTYAKNPPEDHEAPYVEMKTNLCKELSSSQNTIGDILLYLHNTNIDPGVISNISSFPSLFKSLERHDFIHKAEVGWLKAIAKYAKCEKGLEIIEKYNSLLIADKTICSHDSSKKIINGIVAKCLDNSLEKSTIKDCSNAKSTTSKIMGLEETDAVLDSTEVGSLTFYWKVKENITISIPKFIDVSLIKNCKDAGITHIGTITNGEVQLVDVTELEVDASKAYQIEKGTEYLQQQYDHIILGRSDYEEWPPYQPEVYTINILMHHRKKYISNDILKVHKITKRNLKVHKDINTENIVYYAEYPNQYKTVADIFSRVQTESGYKDHPRTILIEGAPGIGKTMLANQLALQWKSIYLLCDKMFLFLIYLRDPKIQELSSVHDLLEYMFRGDKLEDYHECIKTYEDFINRTNGSCLALLFDGYDELSMKKRKSSFVSTIIKREILSESLLIITSRPSGTEKLHCYACRRIELLGFTEQNRDIYLKEVLNDTQKYGELIQYLNEHPTVDTLCYNSLHMTMLLYLFKETNCRPVSQTELFDMFISQTVTHFLNKCGFSYTFDSLSKFRDQHSNILKELGKISFTFLNKDKMVFSLTDLQKECPKYSSFVSKNKCSYGLLKEKRRLFAHEKSYNFLHLTIQEYLAAWHLSNFGVLSQRSINSVLHKCFWEHRFFNMWVLYVGITKGQKFCFRHFISGNTYLQSILHGGPKRLSPEILHEKERSMYLFQCFKESGDLEMCKKLGMLLQNEVIDLSGHQMSPKNINTTTFILKTNEQCSLKVLDLSNCGIGDTGFKYLCEDLIKASSLCKLQINTLNLSCNQLSTSSINLLVKLTTAIRILNLITCDNEWLHEEAILLCKSCKNLDFLYLKNEEQIVNTDETLIKLFYDIDKPCMSVAFSKESIFLQKFSPTLQTCFDFKCVKSLYVECTMSSNNKWLTQSINMSVLLRFHVIINLNLSEEIVSLVMKMNNIKELYVSQLTDEAYTLLVNWLLRKSSVGAYALTSLSHCQAKHVENENIIKAVLRNCCTFQSVNNLIIHNCSFSIEDLAKTIASKSFWTELKLNECDICDSEMSYIIESISSSIKVNVFEVNGKQFKLF